MDGRFVCFVDTAEALGWIERALGRARVVPVSAELALPGVRRVTRRGLPRLAAELAAEHRDAPFSGVIHFREPNVLAATSLAHELGLPAALRDPWRARDKLLMKESFHGHVACARAAAVGAEPERALDVVGVPCVLKPRFGFGSVCTIRIDDARALRREVDEKRDKLRTTGLDRKDPMLPDEPALLLEEFIGGTEHTVDAFVHEGEVLFQIVSDKLSMQAPYFVEAGDVMPSALAPGPLRLVEEAARAAIAAIGIARGFAHVEIKLCDGAAWVMEVGARMGGGYLCDLVQDVYGVDVRRLLVDQHLGRPAAPLPAPRHVVVGQSLLARGVALYWRIAGLGELRRRPWARVLERDRPVRRRGLALGPPFSYDCELVNYLVRGDSHREASARAAEASRLLRAEGIRVPAPAAAYPAYLRAKRRLARAPAP